MHREEDRNELLGSGQVGYTYLSHRVGLNQLKAIASDTAVATPDIEPLTQETVLL